LSRGKGFAAVDSLGAASLFRPPLLATRLASFSCSRRQLWLVLPPLAGALRLKPFEHSGAFVALVAAELEVGETTRPRLPANPGLRHREELGEEGLALDRCLPPTEEPPSRPLVVWRGASGVRVPGAVPSPREPRFRRIASSYRPEPSPSTSSRVAAMRSSRLARAECACGWSDSAALPALAVITGVTSSASIADRTSSLSVWPRSVAASFQRFCSLAVIRMWMYVLRRATAVIVITGAAAAGARPFPDVKHGCRIAPSPWG
jgi:hypothetical protein